MSLLLLSGGAWTPFKLGAALVGYYDAEDVRSVPQVAGAVSSWTDPVTGLACTQGTGANQPIWSATGLNGRPVITADGVNDILASTVNSTYPFATKTVEVWALVSQAALVADTTQRVAWDNHGSSINNMQRKVVTGVNVAAVGRGATQANAPGDFSGIHVVRTIHTATTVQCDLDGAAGAPGAVNQVAGDGKFALFGLSGPSNFWNGGINSVWIIDQAAATANVAANMLAFLKKRGGLP